MFNRQLKSEMPKVKLPSCIRFLRAIGAVRVCVTGMDREENEWIYTTQFRWWHPITLGMLLIIFIGIISGVFRMPIVKRRIHNG